MIKNKLTNRILLFTATAILNSVFINAYGSGMETYDYEINVACYSSNFSVGYTAIGYSVREDPTITRYKFEFEEMSGDLDIDWFDIDIETGDWYSDAWGLYAIAPYNYLKRIDLDFRVLKNDIEPGATRNFRLKFKTREVGDSEWPEDWEYGEEFTVSVSDIPVSGPTGTLCSTSQDYTITPPTGYSASWSFSQSAFVTPSSGTGSTASMSGTCNNMGDGVLTFSMTKSSCPTFQTTRTITVNGPDATDVELDVRYTNGNPVPKSGSVFQLCPNTHYHITFVNNTGCSTSSLSWTLPTGWTKNYQYSNMVSIYTNSSPGGQLIVKGQTCCTSCGSNMTLLTGYFGYYYSCGGYFMASPNPGSNYIDIDIAPEAIRLKEESSEQEIELRVYDKMGTTVLAETVNTLPYRIETSNLPEGNYMVYIVMDKKNGKEKEKKIESIQILVEH